MNVSEEGIPPLDLDYSHEGVLPVDGIILSKDLNCSNASLREHRMKMWNHQHIPGLTIISSRSRSTKLSIIEIDYRSPASADSQYRLYMQSTALTSVPDPSGSRDPHITIFKDRFLVTLREFLTDKGVLTPQSVWGINMLDAGGMDGRYRFLMIPDEVIEDAPDRYRPNTQSAGMTVTAAAATKAGSRGDRGPTDSNSRQQSSGARIKHYKGVYDEHHSTWTWEKTESAEYVPQTGYKDHLG